MEVGGSTDLAAWLPRGEALGLELLSAARHALTQVEPQVETPSGTPGPDS